MAKATDGKVRRALAVAAGAVGTAALFVGAAVGGIALHSGTPAMRRLVVGEANRAMENAFRGTLEVSNVRRFGLGGIEDVNVVVRDAQGRVVLVADGVSARIGLPALAWALVRGKGAIPIAISDAHIRYLDATLLRGPDGQPTLLHAFEPRHPSAPGTPSRAVRVDVSSLLVEQARAHGQVGSFDRFEADLADLAGSFAHGPSGTGIHVRRGTLGVRGVLPKPIVAHLSGNADLPSSGARRASASIEADVDDVPVSVRAVMDGQTVDATVLARPGGGTADVDVVASLAATKTVDATVIVAGVDPRRIVAAAPTTDVHARAHVHARVEPSGALAGVLTLHTEPTSISSQLVPSVDVQASFTEARASGTAHVFEPGAPADLRFEARRAGRESSVDFEAHVQAPDLAQVAQLQGQHAHGSADLRAAGRIDVGRKEVNAGFEASMAGVRVGKSSARTAVARGQVQGPLEQPQGHLTLRAEGVQALGRTADTVTIEAAGPLRHPEVTATLRGGDAPTLDARTTLDFANGVGARDATVRVTRNDTTLTGRIASLQAGKGRVEVRGLQVDGLGPPLRGDASFEKRAVTARLVAHDLRAPTLMRFLGRNDVQQGRIDLDLDLRADARGATGHFDGSFDVAGMFGIRRSEAQVSLKLAGRRVDGGVRIALDDAQAEAKLENVVLGGPASEGRSWRRVTGAVDLSSNVQLATLQKVLPSGAPFQQMGGQLELQAHVARARPEGAPDAKVHLATRGLMLVAAAREVKEQPSYVTQPEQAKPPKQPFRTSGVDVQLDATLEGAENHVALDGSLLDAHGPILTLRLGTTAPLMEIARARGGDAVRILEHVPIEAHAAMPNRDLAGLPAVLRPKAIRGGVEGTLDFGGEVADPRVKLQARGFGVTSMQSRSALPFDGSVNVTYDGRAAIARVVAQRPEGVVLDIRADVDAPIGQFLSPPPQGPAWDAGATVALHGFPLQGIPQIATRNVGGTATGVVTLQGLHRDASVDADIRLDKPRLDVACFQDGFVRLKIDRGRLVADTRLERPGSFADATLNAAMLWGAQLTPALDTSQPIDATLNARDFRASALMPFLRGAVDQLDGRINSNVKVHINPDFKTGQFDGDLVLSDGIVEVPALGEQLHGVGAHITVRPWGTLRVDDITASGTTGKLTGSAQALLDGAKLRSATADIEIPRNQRMPLTIEGVPLGEASGRVHAEATMSPDQRTLDATVNVPDMQMDLPSTSGRSVQSLDPAPHVLIGTYQRPTNRFVILPQHAPEKPRAPGALTFHVVTDLGRDVRVKRSTNLDIYLTGQPVLDVTDTSHLTGTIHLTRGTVDVFGKHFTIEPSSTVAFTGDPGNPQLVVTALYEAPDNTRIFADVVGTPKALKVNLRSEPPLAQDEILGLLLFGSTEGLAGTPAPGEQPDPTQRAAGLASGIVTQGVNEALSGITTLEISTRVDTSQAANPRPELDVRVTNDVLARVTVQTGMPAPGQPPDRTLLTIDWRFKPRWSLQSTVGDEGTTLFDLLWHHRY